MGLKSGMRNGRLVLIAALPVVAACAGQPPTSLADSPIRDVRCPSFLDDSGCLARAKRECGTDRVTLISAPPGDERLGRGSTVPIEGRIEYRILTVRCEE